MRCVVPNLLDLNKLQAACGTKTSLHSDHDVQSCLISLGLVRICLARDGSLLEKKSLDDRE